MANKSRPQGPAAEQCPRCGQFAGDRHDCPVGSSSLFPGDSQEVFEADLKSMQTNLEHWNKRASDFDNLSYDERDQAGEQARQCDSLMRELKEQAGMTPGGRTALANQFDAGREDYREAILAGDDTAVPHPGRGRTREEYNAYGDARDAARAVQRGKARATFAQKLHEEGIGRNANPVPVADMRRALAEGSVVEARYLQPGARNPDWMRRIVVKQSSHGMTCEGLEGGQGGSLNWGKQQVQIDEHGNYLVSDENGKPYVAYRRVAS